MKMTMMRTTCMKRACGSGAELTRTHRLLTADGVSAAIAAPRAASCAGLSVESVEDISNSKLVTGA